MTIGSLISSSGFGSRASRQTMGLSKKDIFSELIYEMEGLRTYFDFEENSPLEEILLEQSNLGISQGIKSIVLTFCPDIRSTVFEQQGAYFKKRIIKSRGLLILDMDIKKAKKCLLRNY